MTFNSAQGESRGHLWYNRAMSTPTTLLDAKLLIKSLSADQLTELQESLNARRGVLDNEAQFRFPRGTPAQFDSGRRGVIRGTVTGWKRGGKAEFTSTGGSPWSVSGSALRPLR